MPKKRENNMEILSRVLAFVSYLSDWHDIYDMGKYYWWWYANDTCTMYIWYCFNCSEAFSFVLTDVTGTRQYGYCRRVLVGGTLEICNYALCNTCIIMHCALYNCAICIFVFYSKTNDVLIYEGLLVVKVVFNNSLPSTGSGNKYSVICKTNLNISIYMYLKWF